MKTNKRLFLNIILIITLGALGQDCVSKTAAEKFVENINKDANSFGKVTLVKDPTSRSGYIIVNENGVNYAVKYDRYTNNHWGVRDRMNFNTYYERNKFVVSAAGDGYYRGPLGWLYEETSTDQKDLETIGAVSETLKITDMAKKFEGEFGFSLQRSYEVAELTNQWNKISKTRSMTQKDKDLFSKKLLGVNFNSVEKALTQLSAQNMEDFDSIIDKAADVNGIGQEHMRDLVEQYLLK